MNTARITEIVEWALRQGVSPSQLGSFRPWTFHIEMVVNNWVQADDSTIEVVSEVLKDEPSLPVSGGWAMIAHTGGGAGISADDLAHWLLAQALLHGSAAAVKRLEEFFGGQHRATLEVMALAGVNVEREMRLPRGVALVPFENLPRWHITEALGPAAYAVAVSSMAQTLRPSPTAALVSRDDDGILLLESMAEFEPAPDSDQLLLAQMCQCLTLVGPSAPTPVARWSQPVSPENVPKLPTGHWWGHVIEEAFPQENTALHDEGDVSQLIEKYLSLSENVQAQLEVPLRRLNLALRRQDVVDRAIELGVALEALLLADRGSDAPLSYLLRVRGAWLAGGSIDERKHNRKLLRDAYNLRSKAVHTGRLEAKAGETLRECSELCAKLIRRVIERSAIPDWETLILTPDIG